MIAIRRATEADLDALVPLKASLHALHASRRPDVFKAMTNEQVSAWLRERLADEATHVWLAEAEDEEAGNKPLGYVLATRRTREESPFSTERAWCDIDEVAVDPSCRRQGIARALIERAAAHARQSGLDTIEISAWAFNETAQAAFTRAGFEPMLIRYELRQ